MKKLTFFGSMLVLAVFFGLALTAFVPDQADALPPCITTPQYRVAVGDCTFKCPPEYIGIKYALYGGYYTITDPFGNVYVGYCNFQGYYCECIEDLIPHQEP